MTEKDRLLGELEVILDHIARLQQVDTSTLAETAQVGDLVNVMRADEPGGADRRRSGAAQRTRHRRQLLRGRGDPGHRA